MDNLIWVVTKKNPLKKKPYLSLKARINLSKKLTKKEKKIHVKFYENKIKSVNTLKLLKYIKNRNQNAALFFLLGADNLIKFHKWKNWEKIPNFAKLVIFRRKNFSTTSNKVIALKKLKKTDLIHIKSKLINISSSLIRKFW